MILKGDPRSIEAINSIWKLLKIIEEREELKMAFVWFSAICLIRLEFTMGSSRAEVRLLSSLYCMQAMQGFM